METRFATVGLMLGSIAVAVASPPETPALPYVDWGACPYEGCVYDDWIASSEVQIHHNRFENSPVEFTVGLGETVRAETGVVVTSRYGESRIHRPLDLPWRRKDTSGTLSLRPGDVLYTLHYQGEGVYLFWFKGQTYGGEIFFPDDDDVDVLSRPVCEWWVKIRNRSGRVGWTKQGNAFRVVMIPN
jgi:hypothetical protein